MDVSGVFLPNTTLDGINMLCGSSAPTNMCNIIKPCQQNEVSERQTNKNAQKWFKYPMQIVVKYAGLLNSPNFYVHKNDLFSSLIFLVQRITNKWNFLLTNVHRYTTSKEKVMKINKVITKGKILWPFIKFSKPILRKWGRSSVCGYYRIIEWDWL